jgi:hypothetical protein
MNIITIFFTVVIINYNYRTPRTNKMPYWMRRLFIDILPRVLCMERPNKYDKDREQERNQPNMINYLRTTRTLSLTTAPSMFNTQQQACLIDDDNNDDDDDDDDDDNNGDDTDVDIFLAKEIYDAAEDLSFIANQMRSACQYEEVFALLLMLFYQAVCILLHSCLSSLDS